MKSKLLFCDKYLIMSVTRINTAGNMYPRVAFCLRETARSFAPAIKRNRGLSVQDPVLNRVSAFLDSGCFAVNSIISPELKTLESLKRSHPDYYTMSSAQREEFRAKELPVVEHILSKVSESGVELSGSRLPSDAGFPDISRMMLNEVHRVSEMPYRMLSVVAEEKDYDPKANAHAFSLGKALAEMQIIPVVGQTNDLIKSLSKGVAENGGALAGIFDRPGSLPGTNLEIIADVGKIRCSVLGRAGRGLLSFTEGTALMTFAGDHDMPAGVYETARFPYGAELVAMNELIPAFWAKAPSAEMNRQIISWITSNYLTDNKEKKYDLLARGRLFPVSVIGSSNIEIEFAGEDLASISFELGRGLADRSFLVLNGAGTGAMLEVSKGTAANGGVSAGIVPERSYAASNHSIDIPVATGIGLSRDCIVADSGKIIIALPGSFGTFDELLIAMAAKKPIISLFSPIPDDSGYPHLYKARDVGEALRIAERIRESS
jgi:uncharacterized protein (TIGR00725 family)